MPIEEEELRGSDKGADRSGPSPIHWRYCPLRSGREYQEMLSLAELRRVLILLKMLEMLVPIVVRMKIAAAPMRTSRSEYSTMS
jgi:hypothetical protein